MKSSTTRRRVFLGAAAAGVAGAAASVATTTPAAAAEDGIPASQKGAANGVAPLDGKKKVPVEHIPTADGKAPASVESLVIRARDRSIASAWQGDQSEQIQAAVNEAAAAGARLVFQKGVYICSNIHIPANSWIGSISTPHSLAGTPPVRIVNQDRADTPTFWWGGKDIPDAGIRLEGLTFWGGMDSVTGPLLHQRSGFEVQLDNIQLLENWHGPGFVIDAASNCRYVDVQVQNCGTPEWPAVMLNHSDHPWRKDQGTYSNTNDFDRLRVERSPNIAMSIGYGDDWDTGFAEFTRLTAPHFETEARATATGPLLQVGNIRCLDIVAPAMYAGPGGAISHEESESRKNYWWGRGDGDHGGITLLGGTVIGRKTNPFGVRLSRGNGFYSAGTKFIRYAADGAAVKIESTYGPDATVDANLRQWGLPRGKGPDGVERYGRLRDVLDERGDAWAPTGKLDPPSGTGATITASGTDRVGSFELKTGNGAKAGPQAVVGFRREMGSVPRIVTLMPRNAAAAKVGAWVNNAWYGSFQFSFANAPADSTSYRFDFIVD